MAYKILIPEDIAEEGKAYLRERGYEIKMGSGNSESVICGDVIDCDGIVVRNTRYTRKIMESGPKLKIIARHGTGVDNIDVEAATELGIQVVNGPAANIDTVAEYTVTMILALLSGLIKIHEETKKGNWDYRKNYSRPELSERTIGIVGFGNVGRRAAEYLLHSFRPRILVFERFVTPERRMEGVEYTTSLDELLRQSDVVTLHVPSTRETRGMMGKNEFENMKKGAVLVNCARGDICVEKELCAALETGALSGAALDVYESEPLAADSPLLKYDNVILSQHCAGLSQAAAKRMALYAAQGIDEYFSGKRLSHPVNLL